MKNPFKKSQEGVLREEEIMGEKNKNNVSRFQESESF